MHPIQGGEHAARTRGQWNEQESQLHINAKELLAAFLGLQTFARSKDYINRMGGTHSRKLMELTSQMWELSLEREIFLSAEYLPGKLNIIADRESRMMGDSSEWKLDPVVFHQIMKVIGPCEVDLFARLSAQLHEQIRINSNRCPESTLEGDKGLCFSPLFSNRQMSLQDQEGGSPITDPGGSSMANPAMVCSSTIDALSEANSSPQTSSPVKEPQQQATPSNPSAESSCVACVRSSLHDRGLLGEATTLILSSWRGRTERAYSCIWRKWEQWCSRYLFVPL